MRLIDADYAIERLQGLTGIVPNEQSILTKALMLAALKTRSICPTVDAVPVVRCYECIFFEPEQAEDATAGHCRKRFGACENALNDMTWFCADGERKEE